ncbi:MAG: nickel-dependent lactate racemase [Candidatus Lokiarchaeota archaeon]|nr:nickel-dependent lactate racemase [Candidatus Lokiarchaeota archaeon]
MKLDYGKDGLEVTISPNWNTTVLRPQKQEVIANPIKAIRDAINNPIESSSLETIIKTRTTVKSVCVVASDQTRPVPTNLILEGVISELIDCGIQEKQIIILIATGLHRASRKEERARILGNIVNSDVSVVNHIATDHNSLVSLSNSKINGPISINKLYTESDLKILTGYVEPHFFFGFSGGNKSLVPGIAGAETILANHSAENIASPYARFGSYKMNPLSVKSAKIAKMIGVDFTVNVCINESHEITQVAAGNVNAVHKRLVDFQNTHVFKEIPKPYDIVICGNGGYPLDLNLYQAVKSMAIGEIAVKQGGTIISVNECREGVGLGQDKFKELIFSGKTPKEIYNKILRKEIVVPDQWEIQVLTRILMKAEVYLVSNMRKEEIGNIGLRYADTVENAIEQSLVKHGKDAKILVLPNGPQILPVINT